MINFFSLIKGVLIIKYFDDKYCLFRGHFWTKANFKFNELASAKSSLSCSILWKFNAQFSGESSQLHFDGNQVCWFILNEKELNKKGTDKIINNSDPLLSAKKSFLPFDKFKLDSNVSENFYFNYPKIFSFRMKKLVYFIGLRNFKCEILELTLEGPVLSFWQLHV